MSVWVVFPSARPHAEVEPILKLWRNQGYRVGLWRDPSNSEGFGECLIIRPYEGYAKAVNALSRLAIEVDPECTWVVATGDDTEPDMAHSAEGIARECDEHFSSVYWPKEKQWLGCRFGVMQPTGDRWGEDPKNNNPAWRSAYIDRVAGSPWMGREFCLRINQGRGPLWPDYYHCFADEELQNVATRLGVFWQRPDLIHLHKHWGRVPNGAPMPSSDLMPDFLKRANSREEWRKAENLFKQRQAAGFPGSEPL